MTTLRVLHGADFHIGRNRKYRDYMEQQRKMLSAVVGEIECALTESRDRVWFVLAGDVFDRKQDTRREELALFLTHFVAPVLRLLDRYDNLTVYVIDGNHDRQPDDPDGRSVLSPLKGILRHPRFRLAAVEPEFYADDAVLAIPYGGYSEAEFNNIIAQHPARFVIAHECFARIRTDLGYTMPRDQDRYIEIDNVPYRLAAMFLGDIHWSQTIDRHRTAWYAGAPVTLDFGHKPPKGLLWWEFRDGVLQGDPVLKALPDTSIRQHDRLEVVADTAKIAWDVCRDYENRYIDLVVTPEVFHEISAQIPDFFGSPTVSWSFPPSAPTEAATPSANVETQTIESFSRSLRDTWIDNNLVALTAQQRQNCKAKVASDFAARG